VLVLQGALASIKRCMKLALNPTGSVEGGPFQQVLGSVEAAHYDGQHYDAPALANRREVL
jgi:hypothetical protein